MKTPRLLCLCLLVALAPIDSAFAQKTSCSVSAFQGASQPQGAVARMRVVNTGRSCNIANYGVPQGQSNPADSGSITRPPAHGSAEFAAPNAKYTPAKGYVGEDEFEYEAFARGNSHQEVRLSVKVKVIVVAP